MQGRRSKAPALFFQTSSITPPGRGHPAAAADRVVAGRPRRRYPAAMDPIALALMATALTYSGYVVLLGWR
ncbi:hypothetical protein AFCDBAGC_4013 [Methylobacterium cerastii]|uniref:Uncharacterized protein n=1 Tax=Methylobacterium cerastii TaxID=932741 RepID=A0ABQ4QLP8_9HYPH|nr:hypothetical protein AFCDBAGC_4013 [Methylobacterium cerastii]